MNEKMRSSVMGLLLGQFSSPLPISQKEPVAYLYNGVMLPALPEWDKETYPYAVIGFNSYRDGYELYCCETKIKSGDDHCWGWTDGLWFKQTDEKTWTYGGIFDFLTIDHYEMVWSNYDIFYQDADSYTDGTIYLSASDPIPVYE